VVHSRFAYCYKKVDKEYRNMLIKGAQKREEFMRSIRKWQQASVDEKIRLVESQGDLSSGVERIWPPSP